MDEDMSDDQVCPSPRPPQSLLILPLPVTSKAESFGMQLKPGASSPHIPICSAAAGPAHALPCSHLSVHAQDAPCLTVPASVQQDITRGRQMTDSLFQGGQQSAGTHNAILSSEDYLSQARRDLQNIEDGFYIAPLFLDKLSIHIAKNFLDLPKIKVPLILGAPPTCSCSPVEACGRVQARGAVLLSCHQSFRHMLTQACIPC